MDYVKIIKAIKEEVDREFHIREEAVYNNGYRDGLKAAEKEKCKCDEGADIEKETEVYLEGVNDAWDTVLTIMSMTNGERHKIFREPDAYIVIAGHDPLELIGYFYENEEDEDSEKEEEARKDIIKAVNESDLNDDQKKLLLEWFDYSFTW